LVTGRRELRGKKNVGWTNTHSKERRLASMPERRVNVYGRRGGKKKGITLGEMV